MIFVKAAAVSLCLLYCGAAFAQPIEQQVDAAIIEAGSAGAMIQQTLVGMRNQIKSDQAKIADLQKQLADAKAAKEAPKP